MTGLRLIVIQVWQRLTHLGITFRRSRGAGIWISRHGRVRSIRADILQQPVVFGGKCCEGCSFDRRNNERKDDWQEKPAERAAHHQISIKMEGEPDRPKSRAIASVVV